MGSAAVLNKVYELRIKNQTTENTAWYEAYN